MTYVRGYGSTPYIYSSTSSGQTLTIEAAGICVVDGVLINGDGISTDFDLTIKDADSNTLKSWQGVDNTNAGAIRDGFYCGQFGFKSSNGLTVTVAVTTTPGNLVSFTVLYRLVFV